jgi:glycine/D-amino acid oxidase-like deaminating enzyme
MELHAGAPFWLVRNGMGTLYPPLDSDQSCDVIVIGAGITGALVADALTEEGVDVVVLDRREPGVGSTAASTALLLYETDLELAPLIDAVGEADAVRSWALGRDAIQELTRLAAGLDVDCQFSPATSLYLASRSRHAKRLRKEAALRAKLGFPADFLDGDEMEAEYGCDSHGAIRASGAGKIDALRFTQRLLARAVGRGARVYGRTMAAGYDLTADGVSLRTGGGQVLTARRVVFATGYEAPELFPDKLVTLHSTFALATERMARIPPLLRDTVVWESARPYTYLRSAPDGQVLIGGNDAPYKNEALRDRALPGRVQSLEERLRTLLRDDTLERAFAWGGTFGETRDALPYIGTLPRYPLGFFALGYGGNGITFSLIAAQIIRDLYLGRENPDQHIFRVDR